MATAALIGVADLASSLFGSYLVRSIVKDRLPQILIACVMLNLTIDVSVGAVPMLRDRFDFVFKANQHNVTLFLERARFRDANSHAKDWAIVLGLTPSPGSPWL